VADYRRGNRGSILDVVSIFIFTIISRPMLGPNQTPERPGFDFVWCRYIVKEYTLLDLKIVSIPNKLTLSLHTYPILS